MGWGYFVGGVIQVGSIVDVKLNGYCVCGVIQDGGIVDVGLYRIEVLQRQGNKVCGIVLGKCAIGVIYYWVNVKFG